MKPSLTYGLVMAIAGALVTFAMYFAGFHDSPEKMQSGLGKWVGILASVAIAVATLSLAMSDRRAQRAPDAHWGYGPALGTGVLTSLFAALFGAVFAYIYFAMINPNMSDVVYQTQVAAMEAKGMTADRIEKAESFMRKMVSPPIMTVFQTMFGFVANVILSAIVAIFFRRRASEATLPPTLS